MSFADLPTLESRDNPRIRQIQRLAARPREVRKAGLALLDGVHLLEALLLQGGAPTWGLVTAGAHARGEVAQAVERARARGTEWFAVPEPLLRAVAPTEHPTGVLCVLPIPAATLAPDTQLFTLLLEDIQDPGNLGTLLRSAQGAGVGQVALSAACAEVWSPKVLRAAMGAHFGLRLCVDQDLPALAGRLGGVLAAAAEGARPAWRTDLAAATGIVIGNEGAGVSPRLRAACAGLVSIPLAAACESLNAAVAGSVLLFERARQRSG